MNDYIKYLYVMNEKFILTKVPRIQINWNVIEDFDYVYRYVTNPCHQDTQYLKDLVELLCSVGHCLEVVYMDMDLLYLTSYSLEVLRMNKQILRLECFI
ncbi:unnamed protein product [Rotaria sp. Silwood1]|nr:unnamed protein product [Rotaria sp. Silwood1]CAF3389004.1 unnamed protein product [Rotaria sp. Silwood1]CAF3389379.1 unnamed protein product [Rotaria sp. Silwood1]